MKYIFKKFVSFILLLKDYGLAHKDIKLDNAMLIDNIENEYEAPNEKKEVRMIDIGGCNNFYLGDFTE